MLSCSSETETVSHISRNINALQPAVFVSTKTMTEKGILTKKGNSSRGAKKALILTDKGIAIAILAGIRHRKLEEYLDSKEYRDEYDRQRHRLFVTIMELIRTPTRRNVILNRALRYMVVHGWYDEEKKIFDQNERVYLLAHLIPYVFTQPTEDVEGMVELIDKFGINKRLFWNMLLEKLDSIIRVINRYGDSLQRHGTIPFPSISDPGFDYEDYQIRKLREMKDELMVLTGLINQNIVRLKETRNQRESQSS